MWKSGEFSGAFQKIDRQMDGYSFKRQTCHFSNPTSFLGDGNK